MGAIENTAPGGPGVLQPGERPAPEPLLGVSSEVADKLIAPPPPRTSGPGYNIHPQKSRPTHAGRLSKTKLSFEGKLRLCLSS